MHAEKLATEGASQNPLWEITNAVPLNYDGTSVEAALGNNPDVHYIYVCIKEVCTITFYFFDYQNLLRPPSFCQNLRQIVYTPYHFFPQDDSSKAS